MKRLAAALCLGLTLGTATSAEAAPIFAAIGTFASTVSTAFAAGGFFTSTIVGRLLLGVALSALQRALMPKPREAGIKTKVTQTGGTNPLAFPLLKTATAGTHACPPMSHGAVGKTPNAYLTYVIVLSDVPGAALSRYMINGQYVTLGTTPHPDYGLPVTGNLNGFAWIKVYNGFQTAADPMLLSKYGTYPERPWQSDMIGRGTVYAICTFRYNRERFPGLPRVRFELDGIPLYDPRKDSTVGGSGLHRWANRATWEPTVNPQVGIYNLLRGVALEDGSVYGGNFPAADVPLATWFAGMNECDMTVSTGAGPEPQFRAGLEVSVDEEPADMIAELMKASAANIAEIGGLWKTRVGPPGTPVYLFSDADVVSSAANDFQPFPNMAGSFNGAHATYPDPEKGWETSEAEPYYNATHEAADRNFRLTADLNLVACPYPAQVRRLQFAYVEEERRFRQHEFTLPPDAAVLEPLDATGWTSAWNGYSAKVFEIDQVAEEVLTGLVRVVLKERDAADYSYPGLPPPVPISILPVIPPPQEVPSFAVAGITLTGSTGAPRRTALRLTWDPVDLDGINGLEYEVRRQGTTALVVKASTLDIAGGEVVAAGGILPNTAYEARARLIADREVAWTPWTSAITPNVLIPNEDLDLIQTGRLAIRAATIVYFRRRSGGPLSITTTSPLTPTSLGIGLPGPFASPIAFLPDNGDTNPVFFSIMGELQKNNAATANTIFFVVTVAIGLATFERVMPYQIPAALGVLPNQFVIQDIFTSADFDFEDVGGIGVSAYVSNAAGVTINRATLRVDQLNR